ncbi:hypothetical protein PN36_13950 [Candidatus Thiomargarita nelsonii]|uniref:Uncharacterized protein n=1 Tax=Candidatus Thiomargarita nelsonii TaxID=1003181 RepID=A0A4E0QP68_9GAMM|nr:hypothetical protein PN36_13950 [Candidatus Thiomargarita nelsonii]
MGKWLVLIYFPVRQSINTYIQNWSKAMRWMLCTPNAVGVQSFSFGRAASSPKLKLWTPSAVGVQSFSFGGAASSPKLKLWTPSAFDVKIKKRRTKSYNIPNRGC